MEKVSPKKFTLTQSPDHPLVHDLSGHPKNKTWIILTVLGLILAGGITGWALSGDTGDNTSVPSTMVTSTEDIKPGKIVGSADEKVFRDSAEGVLRDGGLEGEGTHHLEREGGPSKTAYLTSSVLNLSDFVGKKVKVWGETHAAKKAGWLMDVGKIEVLP